MTRAPMSELDDWELQNPDQDIRGWPVRSEKGGRLGTVTEMIGNTDSEYVDALRLDTGAVIPVSDIELGDGVVYADAGGARSDGDDMVVSAERFRVVGTERVPIGQVRLRKRIVTENVAQTVPVSRDEIRVEREPIPPGERDRVADRPLGSDEIEVSVNEEQVVVDKETVPVERVRLDTEQVTDEVAVSGQLRREEVELEEPQRR